jgi:glycosyltransferase involved in cell wall biosynthesis
MLELKDYENILIKTYSHDSGLLYLGLSLYKTLLAAGHNVSLIPKPIFEKKQGRYYLEYPEVKGPVPHLFKFKRDGLKKNEVVQDAVEKQKTNLIVSLETSMTDLGWINEAKRNKVKVVDVPMLEWVPLHHFNKMSYNVFDKVWCLTEYTWHTFNRAGYKNLERINWNYVDEDLFNSNNRGYPNQFYFYHQASLNNNYSSKNTQAVVQAFLKLSQESKDQYPVNLIITGNYPDNKVDNIKVSNQILDRNEIAAIYKMVNCVVAPSSREGLGLSLYEAAASGCDIITTDYPPMNSVNTKYLCKVSNYEWDGSLVPIAKVSSETIYEQMKKVYEEHYVRKSNS